MRFFNGMGTFGVCMVTASLLCMAMSSSADADSRFAAFETGQVRPLALSPAGELLFAANTPDNRIEVYAINAGGLEHRSSIPVGLEPVAIAARSESEVWVVNHLSDSVSIVAIGAAGESGRVMRTLLVGDEPRDIVFGGLDRSRAFITTAHRGQNISYDPQLTTPGVGRADVWVFDADQQGASLTGDPLTIINLFTDTPRALAVSPDGATVYAAGFHTGNRTATVNELMVPDGGEAMGGLPWPNTNADGALQPEVGLIVKHDGTHWVDELGRSWDHAVKFHLPDEDVFAIDATANPPERVLTSDGVYAGVGTVLFNMVVNPVNGNVYVSNTEAFNEIRFEGEGTYTGLDTVRGHLHESRITVLSGSSVLPRHLNKHIDYSSCCAAIPNEENERSLAFPQEMVVTSDGSTLYVAALGSSEIGIYDTAALENDTFVPSVADQIAVSGGGPIGLVIDEARGRLYALTRFDNSISIVDINERSEIGHVAMYNPEPESIVAGRRFLYDASFSSSHGDSACASCHVFGDFDSLAWDLGNPDGAIESNDNPFFNDPVIPLEFHPLKGPMVTQSLRGMANHGPMHWRGDRNGSAPGGLNEQPDGGGFDEFEAFTRFQGAFVSLLGRHEVPADEDMEAFAAFMLQVMYPPNPNRALDNSLTPEQEMARDFFFNAASFEGSSCNDCHTLDPTANEGLVDIPGFFGSNGLTSFIPEPQHFKNAHLRNMYQKVGMFGMPATAAFPDRDHEHMGDQVRGIGFLHDGTVDTVFRFVSSVLFAESPTNPGGFPAGPAGEALLRGMESYLLAFDSNLAPIVGQQITLSAATSGVAHERIDLLIERAEAGECDLVAKSSLLSGYEIGLAYAGGGAFARDRAMLPNIADSMLRFLTVTTKSHTTYTCVPPGSGIRIGIDRDDDGALDGDERLAGTDPADPDDTP